MQATGELVAGQELDALVAEKVMGWKPRDDMWWKDAEGTTAGYAIRPMGRCEVFGAFQPSTDIAAAWQVVKHMSAAGWSFEIDHHPPSRDWVVRFYRDEFQFEQAATAPLAICRAALKAVSRAG